jgi:hypothetical protein
MDDVFHAGIQGAANVAGLLCKRADTSALVVTSRISVKRLISTARLLIANLSSANSHVHREIA